MHWTELVLTVPAGLTVLAAGISDIVKREASNVFAILLAINGIFLTAVRCFLYGAAASILNSAAGAGAAFILIYIFYRKEGVGGADVKILTALGMITGIGKLAETLLVIFLTAAAVLLPVSIIKKKNSGFPLLPFVFAGYLYYFLTSLI